MIENRWDSRRGIPGRSSCWERRRPVLHSTWARKWIVTNATP